MGDIQNRPFSKNYSGLINQSVIALGITVICITSQELMKRRRRGKFRGQGLGSRESWEFGYLFQGRSWARNPSPPSPAGRPLSWVKQAVYFPEDKMNELRGLDATLYTRFLRGCFWFSLLQTFTTLPILFPIHVHFAEDVSTKSMTRASIASLVATSQGLSLLWIHICLLFWVTLTWMATLIWIIHGAFRLRGQQLEIATQRVASAAAIEKDAQYHPHPHPQYPFQDIPSLNCDREQQHEGLRLRTVMVSNVPHSLRSEKELKEYFEYYMSRPLDKPSMGLTSSTQPGFFNRIFSFLFNRVRHIPVHLPASATSETTQGTDTAHSGSTQDVPVIVRVVIARRMTELASLLERREEVLSCLETAHIKLARKTLLAVKQTLDQRLQPSRPICKVSTAIPLDTTKKTAKDRSADDVERGDVQKGSVAGEERMDILIRALAPYVDEFNLHQSSHVRSKKVSSIPKHAFQRLRAQRSEDDHQTPSPAKVLSSYPPSSTKDTPAQHPTIWEALLGLERSLLDPYQPLANLSHVFRGQPVPAIDFYNAKLGLLTALITENRSKAVTEYDPVSTAFVTFADPSDARRACRYLAVNPKNPLMCLVTMAPMYQDLDWNRVMKSFSKAEFLKDSVVNVGVWAFTLFWLLPVSLLVSLVSIQNISAFLPKLKAYLDRHSWEEELIQSFLPTLLVALLALLIPLILLLIAKKAHTITTLSALHDTIMVRYYKFLIVNVLVFFCVGTLALQSVLLSFKATTRPNILKVVGDSFPTAGPFYVGWLIFTTAMHAGFELALFGLPLIMYPSTSRQVTPRKRAVGIRPRTFNFYYWLPNHMLIIHILLLFAILNPFVIPFATFYFFIETGVVKNQLIHVYAKNYEGNGRILLIRFVRYSLDGLMLSQAVFLAYMVVLKKSATVGLAAFLIVFTAIVKIAMTRMIRAQYETDDVSEAQIVCGRFARDMSESESTGENLTRNQSINSMREPQPSSIWTSHIPGWMNFSYSPTRQRVHHQIRRQPNPFGPQCPSFSRLGPELNHNDAVGEPTGTRSKVDPIHQGPRLSPFVNSNPQKRDILDPLSPVVRHPVPVAWDDESLIDLPYDNPYYTRAIDNVLWLPRDPIGILDLDDTVDLRVSLTCDPHAVPLGTWLGNGETSSPKLLGAEINFPEPSGRLNTLQKQYSGSEEIDLPSGIAKRVQALDEEDDIEDTIPQRPSMFGRRKFSSGDKDSSGLRGTRKSSTIDGPPQSGFRSYSASSVGRHRSASVLSALEPPRVGHLSSTDQPSGTRPDAHAQADFVRSNLSIAHASASQLSVAPPLSSRSQNVTTHDALVTEIIAQETSALVDRLEEEWAESRKEKSQSWLTSWMFQKRE